MPFYRFEQFEDIVSNPHLSTGKGPIIEGAYMNLRLNNKEAGTGSKLHYHPNELMVFPIRGCIDSVVGKDERVVPPGMFVHVAPNVLHSMRATTDGPVSYLYVKDRTWSMVGVAADEAPPAEAPSITEVRRAHDSGKWPGGAKAPEHSHGIPDAPGDSYFPIIDQLDAPPASARRSVWIEGGRLAFGFCERPPGDAVAETAAAHEQFIYVISGEFDARIDDDGQQARPGDILHVPRRGRVEMAVGDTPVRYVVFQPMSALEAVLDDSQA